MKELVGWKNYDEWLCLLRLNLDSLGLEKYLDEQAFDKISKFLDPIDLRTNKSKVSFVIQSSISSDVRARLIKLGWNPENRDPKVLFAAIVNMHSKSRVSDLLEKMLATTPKEFLTASGSTDFNAFRSQIEHLRDQIETLDPDFQHELEKVMELHQNVIAAIVKDYPNFRHTCADESWEGIMWELNRLASDPDGYELVEW